MSWRALRVLVERLPPESATMTALRREQPPGERAAADPEAGRWSQVEMLLAALIDEVRRNSYYLLAVNGNKTSAPEPVPRPGLTRPVPRSSITDEGAELLLQFING